mgnify:CR=1 FL=1
MEQQLNAQASGDAQAVENARHALELVLRSRAISRKLRSVQSLDEDSAAALLELETEPGRLVMPKLPDSDNNE